MLRHVMRVLRIMVRRLVDDLISRSGGGLASIQRCGVLQVNVRDPSAQTIRTSMAAHERSFRRFVRHGQRDSSARKKKEEEPRNRCLSRSSCIASGCSLLCRAPTLRLTGVVTSQEHNSSSFPRRVTAAPA